MIEKYSIDSELRALVRIGTRCSGGYGDRSFSPIENIDGTNPILDSIDALRVSPLCWEGMPTMVDCGQAGQVLETLRDLYERAMTPWEKFRKVKNPGAPMYSLGMGHSVDIEIGRPFFNFPVKVRREAKLRYFELMSTSRFSVNDEPNKRVLEGVHPPGGAIAFAHLAGLAATVCVVRAVDEFERTLADWADACGLESGRAFTWLAQHDSERLEGLLAAHFLSRLGDHSSASGLMHEVGTLVKSAEGWLALADEDVRHQSEIEKTIVKSAEGWIALADAEVRHQSEIEETTMIVAVRVGQEILAAEAEKRSFNARNAGRNSPKIQKPPTAQQVADYCNARPGQKVESLVYEMGAEKWPTKDFPDGVEVSESTVRRRYKEAVKKKLLSVS